MIHPLTVTSAFLTDIDLAVPNAGHTRVFGVVCTESIQNSAVCNEEESIQNTSVCGEVVIVIMNVFI